MNDRASLDLFADLPERPGGLACAVEIAMTMGEALAQLERRGTSRDDVVERMTFHLGERISKATLDSFTALSRTESGDDGHGAAGKPEREISLRRAMAFDAAVGSDVLLSLYARKRGERRVVTADEAAFIELGRIHQQERVLAERKRALQTLLKTGPRS